ncbi:MAG: NnrS family protein [Acetobacteraceae bacterium]
MTAIPRYRPHQGPALLSAGFRPFFLLSGLAAAVAIPLWLLAFAGIARVPSAFPPLIWHVHEMVFGFGLATVAGFLFTAVPNWTGQMPLQGAPLGWLVALWLVGRVAVFGSGWIGEAVAAPLDLAFPAALMAVMGREILAGRNWRNLPVIGALGVLLAADVWVHLGVLGAVGDARGGNRLGVAVLLLLISMMGGRLIPSFTRNWLARARPAAPMPAPFGIVDRIALGAAALALLAWVAAPDAAVSAWTALAAGVLLASRLARWQGWRTWREPLLLVLHLGYAWLAGGFLLLGLAGLTGWLAPIDAVHALTVGAIGTMTLAVMTRATLGHTGQALRAGRGTCAAYVLVGLAALLRLTAPLAGADTLLVLALAGAAWTGAFGLFVVLYAGPLVRPRARRPATP